MGQMFSSTEPSPDSYVVPSLPPSIVSSRLQASYSSRRDRQIEKRRPKHKSTIRTISMENRDSDIVHRVANALVGKAIQVFWPNLCAWYVFTVSTSLLTLNRS